jgi:hypothetical protein
MFKGRQCHRDECSARDGRGDRRSAKRGLEDRLPEPVLTAVAPHAAEKRDLPFLDAVAELRQQRRQDGQRAEHGDADDRHRRDAEADGRLVAREEHSGHRDHDGQSGDEHGAA